MVKENSIKKILITGANFNNKGAQSMLFVTVDEIRRRHPEADILFQSYEKLDLSNYKFRKVRISDHVLRIAAGGICSIPIICIRLIKDCVKYVIGRRQDFLYDFKVVRELKSLDFILDISGFALGDQWKYADNISYILKLNMAQKLNIPLYLMPQSIGPFHYEKNIGKTKAKKIRNLLYKLLWYPEIIFVREKSGVNSLKEIGINRNVVLSGDLVLQNTGVNIKNIFVREPKLNVPIITTSDNVGIVPNNQCIVHGNEKQVIEIYYKIICFLVEKEKNVYLIRHSNDDTELCSNIYKRLESSRIHMINDELSCLEYDELTKNFDFIIGSRFHGIIHALRNTVPCIALGWADKYQELLEYIGQKEFVFNIIESGADITGIIKTVEIMMNSWKEQKTVISDRLIEIQKNNCFKFLDKTGGMI